MENSSYAGDRKGTAPTIDELVEQCLRSIVGAIPCGRPLELRSPSGGRSSDLYHIKNTICYNTTIAQGPEKGTAP